MEDPDGNGQAVTLNVRFAGQYYDQETGLHYNYYRYYDPGTGRYLTSDPVGLRGGLNTYLYANSNPLIFIDPFGLAPFCPPGHRAVPANNYEDQFPQYFNCHPYPSAPPYELPEKFKCMSDCLLKNAAFCTALTIGGAGVGMIVGGVASIPSGGTTAPVFVPTGGRLGGAMTAEVCTVLKMDCSEKCKKIEQCK